MGIPEAALRLGISRQAVHSAIKRGIIRAERDGYYWRISHSELDRLMQPDEIARRAKFAPRKEGSARSDDNGGSAYGRDGLTATTNRRGA